MSKKVHCPGIEPGSQEWESCMIPLHQQCHGSFVSIDSISGHPYSACELATSGITSDNNLT